MRIICERENENHMSERERERTPGYFWVKVSHILLPLPPSSAAPSYCKIPENQTHPITPPTQIPTPKTKTKQNKNRKIKKPNVNLRQCKNPNHHQPGKKMKPSQTQTPPENSSGRHIPGHEHLPARQHFHSKPLIQQ